MTLKSATFKDSKESKEKALLLKGSKELHRAPKGGHTNLLREALELEQEELEEDMKELDSYFLGEDDLDYVCTCNADFTCEAHRA